MLEIKTNLALGAMLALAWLALTAGRPTPAFEADRPGTTYLAHLEDAHAQNPADAHLAQRLAESYLGLNRPGLAATVLEASDPTVLEHPMVLMRLAQAYERIGRVPDALATGQLAYRRCGRSLGALDAPAGTPVPRFTCDAREHAAIGIHLDALRHLDSWGVVDPAADPRTASAYQLAERRAHVAFVPTSFGSAVF